MEMIKYVIDENNIPLLFSREKEHIDVQKKVRSAGFLFITFDNQRFKFKVVCFGESTSLKIKSNPVNDNLIIEEFLNKILKNKNQEYQLNY